ncbi:MAG TPA: hypothetical protein VFO95_00640 [Gemmatimonadales bacterium]|nr:hypothetical protein [Gemmatimonadales bacterium]
MRASQPTLVAASRVIASNRDAMVARWNEWLGERLTASRAVSRALVERQLRLIIDVLAAMIGPLRRETKPIWVQVTEHYGRIAALRGLAAGEVVEEMQYLREVLIRHLAPTIAAMRPRQGMALLLRLNRLVDKGVAMAVVGYTDALVHTLLPGDEPHGNGAPTVNPEELQHELDLIARGLQTVMSAARH